ncbi:RusA family crossover junction endodeoxyribonuclease [Acerihabitans sp. TG2]|uniref:RusA family crossover junction endodeoxyribonuclease n=1 Tax=Acerihabitans sp. TG2 TaxID=3096008 RepID=UPI002B22F8A0|nr:RusA family crossover junction endodeoxyribonuclease [Acerihabitans sp. TG2]MEA9393141.1 RusA family crossover junction endodeoxyribonuclease [Acerihabitans sp. TG2]
MILLLPFPPSVNSYWRSPNTGPLAGRHLISSDGRRYRTAVFASVVEQLRRMPVALVDELTVSLVLCPPDQRRRDLDNCFKALFDALTHAGIWQDDSQVKRLSACWGPITKPGQVKITIGEFIREEDSFE